MSSIINMQRKSELSLQEMALLESEMGKKGKNKGIAFILWFFFGGIGGHRYYLGDYYAIIMTITLGGLGVWTLIDAFLISGRIDSINEEVENEVINNINTINSKKGQPAS